MATELRGIGIGREAAVGEVYRWQRAEGVTEQRKASGSVGEEKEALTAALSDGVTEVRAQAAQSDADTAAILEALLMIFEDDELVSMASPHLDEGWDAATALYRALDDLSDMMGDDEDFQSRVDDLRGIAQTIGARLRGLTVSHEMPAGHNWVVVADDLTPLDTSQFGDGVVGVVTEYGGPTSHTAIICRSRGIPAVVGAAGALGLADGSHLLVDPVGDRVLVDADMDQATRPIEFVPHHDEPLVTVRANIGSLADAKAAAETEARGVGLFRTEVMYLEHTDRPSREEQAAQFEEVFRAAPAGKIIVRTIDAGSDKPVPFMPNGEEENPALGVRGFRLGLAHPDFQHDQLGAIADAINATGRDVGVMAPMVSSVDEARQFAQMARDDGLTSVGIMIETPAIVPMIPALKGVVDFVSVGTNDLSQYLFAADRMHPAMGALVDPWQPALLRTLAQITVGAQEAGVEVGVCGESAADPVFSVVLAGLGVTSVSVASGAVESVRGALRTVTSEQAQQIAAEVLTATSSVEAKKTAHDALSLAVSS
jgi:phosphotransferase system enzyme I (PtsI)